MLYGTVQFIAAGNKPTAAVPCIGVAYIAVVALVINLVLSGILTPIFEAIGARRGRDVTSPSDYDEEEAPVEPVEVGREALG